MSVGNVNSSPSVALAAFLHQKAATADTKDQSGAPSTGTAGSSSDPANSSGTSKTTTYTTRDSPVEDIIAEITDLLSNGSPAAAKSGRLFDQSV
jgi:hypothetical protein